VPVRIAQDREDRRRRDAHVAQHFNSFDGHVVTLRRDRCLLGGRVTGRWPLRACWQGR
jgi:hypothetical protein